MDFTKKNIEKIKTLGEILRSHREGMRMPIEKAGRLLQISPRYLQWLENDDFASLPPDVYSVNILRNYAELLQISSSTAANYYYKEKKRYANTRQRIFGEKHPIINNILNFFLDPRLIKYSAMTVILALVLTYLGWGVYHIIVPPILVIDEPATNILTDKYKVVISGHTEKEVSLALNGRPILSQVDGGFTQELSLHKGVNEVRITAERKHSRTAVAERTIIVGE